MTRELVDGHVVEIRDEGGRYVYIDGKDRTNEVLSLLGPRQESHGIPIPRADEQVIITVEHAIRSGRLEP